MDRKPSFAFFGTPEFAAIILQKLIDGGFVPQAIITNPDRPQGRKRIITPPPAKRLAETINEKLADKIQVLQPEILDAPFIARLSSLRADFFVVAAYAKILPREIVALPRLGTIGVHPSLLPEYRGASPIQSALLHGERETGVTLFLLDEKVDHGPVLARAACRIAEEDTYETLLLKLAAQGGDLLAKIIPAFVQGTLTPAPQNEAWATSTRKFTADDGFIDENDLRDAQRGDAAKAEGIFRKIRALNPEPGVWTAEEGVRMKLLAARLADGRLVLTKIQKEGKKPAAPAAIPGNY